MEKQIPYTTLTYQEYRDNIVEMSRRYYSDIFNNLNDASIGSWLIDVVSDVADTLSYNINRVYQENGIDSAQERSSLLNIARTNGVKVPGPKAALVELELSCDLPLNSSSVSGSSTNQALPDESYAPIVKKGSLFSNGNVTFELLYDVDFSKQFDLEGISNRQMLALRNSNGVIVGYRYKKLCIASASQSKVQKRIIRSEDIKPFMSVLIQDTDIISVDSIILKQGTRISSNPAISEYFVDRESFEGKDGLPVKRFFEVDNLVDQYRFGYEDTDLYLDNNGKKVYYAPVWDVIDAIDDGTGTLEPVRMAMRGEWKRVKNKFVTEFTESGNLNIIFGAGIENEYGTIPSNASLFTQYMMSRMEANDYMGVLPDPNTTMYIMYRTGGGAMSNVAENTVNNVVYLSMEIPGNSCDDNDSAKRNAVRSSFSVTNTSISFGGKDVPSDEELRNYIKYRSGSQNRCVTVKDYYAKLFEMDPRYGLPFRFSVSEENNKVVIYTLGLTYEGKLTSLLSETVADNMKAFLSKYKMINDFVEIRSGRVINVGFECDVFVDKSYDNNEVSKRIIEKIQDFMDVRRHRMGENIFIGELEKEISQLDGVVNLIALRCYNMVGNGYSSTVMTQDMVDYSGTCNVASTTYTPLSSYEVDLKSSDKLLISDANSMFEIQNPNVDIVVNTKRL